jgi:ABC-type antimicrobial peptide transport system permease subunit
MIVLEAALIGLVSIFISLSILAVFNYFAADYLNNVFGVSTQFNLITPDEALTLLTIFIIALISSFIPAIIIYRKNLNQSLS